MSFNIFETVGGELNFYFRPVLRPNDGCVTLSEKAEFRREAALSAALIVCHGVCNACSSVTEINKASKIWGAPPIN
jgi:hypothetical protein